MDLKKENCTCPFKKEETGIYHGQSAPECLSECRSGFLLRAAGSNTLSWDTCTRLQEADWDQATALWPLYWCDINLCGVWVDPENPYGQDPNIDLIKTTCLNLGVKPILDPGRPPADYECTFCGTVVASSDDSTLIGSLSTMATASQGGTTNAPSSVAGTEAPIQVSSSSTAAVPLTSNTSSSPPTTPNRLMTTGVKIAIGVCSAVAFIALVVLIFSLVLRHRRRRPSYQDALRKRIRITHDFSPPEPGSPAALLSPVNSTTSEGRPPLTPPPRLRDRKFLLPSMMLKPPPPPFGGQACAHCRDDAFPTAPICAPTTNKLVPRQEKAARGAAGGPRSPPPPPGFSLPRASLGSYAPSGTTTVGSSSLRNEVVFAEGAPGPHVAGAPPGLPAPVPSSPARPPRPSEPRREALGLAAASPALGPPPRRDLPPPPVSPPSSPPPRTPRPVSPLPPPPPPRTALPRMQEACLPAAAADGPSTAPRNLQGQGTGSVTLPEGHVALPGDACWAGSDVSGGGGLGLALSTPVHPDGAGGGHALPMPACSADGPPLAASLRGEGVGTPSTHEEEPESPGGRY